jgi:hypothetical protein
VLSTIQADRPWAQLQDGCLEGPVMLVVTPVPWFWAFFFHFIPCCFFQQSYIYVALMYPDVNHISVYITFIFTAFISQKRIPFKTILTGLGGPLIPLSFGI